VSRIDPIFAIELDNFLQACGSAGGRPDEYVHHMWKCLEKDPEPDMADVVARLARAKWKSETRGSAHSGQGDLWAVDGMPIPSVLTFNDLQSPGSHRKVKVQFATLEHMRDHVMLKYRKIGEARSRHRGRAGPRRTAEMRGQGLFRLHH
jgi:hypothetical protein